MKRFPAMLALVLVSTSTLAATVSGHPTQLAIEAGIDEGGLAVGADFLVGDTKTESYGAYARLYSKDEVKGAPAIFAVGASVRGQMKSGIFEYYLSPGFGLLHHNLGNTELLFGPTLAYGLTADLNPNFAVGIENTKLYSWIGEYKGLIKDTFLAQIRFTL